MGHMRSGSTPIDHQSHAKDKKLTTVLGVDNIRSSLIHIQDGNLDEAGRIDCLKNDVFPTCGPNRVLLYDNFMAHLTVRATQLVIRAGHTPLVRPVHSPWLAPIRFTFGLMEAHLRRITHLVTRGNFRRCIIHAQHAATTFASSAAGGRKKTGQPICNPQ